MATFQRRLSKKQGVRITATVRVHSYPPQSKTFGRLTDARAWAEDLESDIRNGRYRPFLQEGKKTLGELIDRYVEETFSQRRSKEFPFSVLRWWKKKLGYIRLCDLTKSLIKEAWQTLEEVPSCRTGKSLSNRTLNGYIENLSACLSYGANDLEWIEHNPCIGIRKKSTTGNWRLRILTDEELKRLLEAIQKSSNDYLLPATLMALSTGARRGELMNLTWDDVNLLSGEVTFQRTKNGYARTVSLSPSALEALKKHSKVRRIDTPLIFPSRRYLWKGGEGASSKRWEDLQNPFLKALKRAGISDFKWHDLRHQAASLLIASGASLEEVGKILGHRTPQMTWRYAKLLQERNKELALDVDEKFIKEKLITQ